MSGRMVDFDLPTPQPDRAAILAADRERRHVDVTSTKAGKFIASKQVRGVTVTVSVDDPDGTYGRHVADALLFAARAVHAEATRRVLRNREPEPRPPAAEPPPYDPIPTEPDWAQRAAEATALARVWDRFAERRRKERG